MLTLDIAQVEEASRELYIRALKILPDDIKQGFQTLSRKETNTTAQSILGTMIKNISVAEDNNNLLCQDTGIPIYNLIIGTQVNFNGADVMKAIEKGCSRATVEHPIRSSVVHPITRKNNHTSCGHRVPVVNISFVDRPGWARLEMIPKGSGSENNSWLKMAIPAEGINAVKTFVIDCVLQAGGKTCPPTIVGVGIGGTSDLCIHLAKELTKAVNALGVGPQGLGGDSTSFAVHIEMAATHITMNPVAVNMQCHSARRASAEFSSNGLLYGF
jgi:tartrate/fumarate subfamily iron-sulfur-dependent hydro-lyase alpha chain